MKTELKNPNIKDISSFLSYDNIRSCFCRGIGSNAGLSAEIKNADCFMTSDSRYIYRRVTAFPAISCAEEAEYYSHGYEKLNGNTGGALLKNVHSESTDSAFKSACKEVLGEVRASRQGFNATMEKNLAAQLIYWSDLYLTDFFTSDVKKMCKLICSGKIGYKEYSFCMLAALMGIDTLILLPSGDINIGRGLADRSSAFVIGTAENISLPEFDISLIKRKAAIHAAGAVSVTDRSAPAAPVRKTRQSAERTYEELAGLAESVVMIEVQDRHGETVGAGSGIVISRKGYILTNCHVAAAGVRYIVRTENDSEPCPAGGVVKYHPQLDLAVIRIEKSIPPLEIYKGREELKRGQKVVAIGSPLGLFNSVSDGIISGIRKVEGIEMIQFTAPISHGSSGGALLNMQGQVIGISTAGVYGGQNINLAVGYKDINMFIGNLVD